jgi:hypothetical protein
MISELNCGKINSAFVMYSCYAERHKRQLELSRNCKIGLLTGTFIFENSSYQKDICASERHIPFTAWKGLNQREGRGFPLQHFIS